MGGSAKKMETFFSRRPQNIAKWTTPTSKNAVFTAAVTNIWGARPKLELELFGGGGNCPPLSQCKTAPDNHVALFRQISTEHITVIESVL